MQNQQQTWSNKALLTVKGYIHSLIQKAYCIVYYFQITGVYVEQPLKHCNNHFQPSQQDNFLLMFLQFFCPCQERSCMDLNFSKRFQKTKNSYFKYSMEHNDLLYIFTSFLLGLEKIQLLEQFLKYLLMIDMVLSPSFRTTIMRIKRTALIQSPTSVINLTIPHMLIYILF